jgi:hypothetical protein
MADLIDEQKDELGNLLTILYRDDQEWPIAGSSHFSDWRRACCISRSSLSIFDLSLRSLKIPSLAISFPLSS